jgi:hypothetical protein
LNQVSCGYIHSDRTTYTSGFPISVVIRNWSNAAALDLGRRRIGPGEPAYAQYVVVVSLETGPP